MDRGSRLRYGLMPAWWQDIVRWYDVPFGPKVAEKLPSYPVLNPGVFAIRTSAPHWDAWEKSLSQALRHGAQVITDQTVAWMTPEHLRGHPVVR